MVWIISAMVLAALISPWLYQAGKALAQAAAGGALPSPIGWLGMACGRADFDRYFSRALVFSALLLLPVLYRRLRTLRTGEQGEAAAPVRVCAKSALIQIVVGCVIAGGLLWGMGMLMECLGVYAPRANPPTFGKWLGKILVPSIVAPLLEEWLFRGVLLGLWLRFAKPVAACIGTSLFFAFLHFLKLPEGADIAQPASALAGFELLGKVLLHFTNPRFFVMDFATLFVIGMILSWARLRTGALWFSIGLHAGWILAFKSFNLYYGPAAGQALKMWGVGETLRSGIFPLLTLCLTAALCQLALRCLEIRGWGHRPALQRSRTD